MSKTIINGKAYNTETARFLGSHSDNLSRRDFRFYYEELYLKKTGEFFLSGEGGPMSAYAAYYDDGMRGSGTRILPLTEAEAREWVENNLDYEDYIEIFGEPEE